MYDESNKKIETLKWKLVTNKWNTLIDYTIKPIDVREGTSGTSADVPTFIRSWKTFGLKCQRMLTIFFVKLYEMGSFSCRFTAGFLAKLHKID